MQVLEQRDRQGLPLHPAGLNGIKGKVYVQEISEPISLQSRRTEGSKLVFFYPFICNFYLSNFLNITNTVYQLDSR